MGLCSLPDSPLPYQLRSDHTDCGSLNTSHSHKSMLFETCLLSYCEWRLIVYSQLPRLQNKRILRFYVDLISPMVVRQSLGGSCLFAPCSL